MHPSLPTGIAAQLASALAVLDAHLGASIIAVHLFGSAVEGGLKPHSDIDLLISVPSAPTQAVRQALLRDLLAVSAPPGEASDGRRPLELTVIALSEVLPWRHPARRELQFGEWLRDDLQAGRFEPPQPDHDLALLLTQARQHSLALRGPEAATLLPAVPRADLQQALRDTVAQWQEAADWAGDERNIVLALARIAYTTHTGAIAPKDVAAAWLHERLPAAHPDVLAEARAAYLGTGPQQWTQQPEDLAAWIARAKAFIDASPKA